MLRRRPSDRRKADEDTGESNLSKSWGFRKDFRGSDRRRKVSNIQEGEPSRGTSSLRFQVPSRPGRKPSTTETPTKTTTISAPQGREAIVYSPASSSFSMASVSSNRGSTPCSDMFFASGNFKTQLSFENVNNLKNNYTFLRDLKVYNNNIFTGNTTPSHMMSPPPTNSHFGSPLLLSPPLSPPPLTTIPASPSRIDTESTTPIILSPVPASPTRNMTRNLSPFTPLNQQRGPMGSSVTGMTLSASGQRVATKSKTDDLERYIAEIEASEAAETPTVRKYTRRRYTESRHPTTELPDMTSASTGAINTSTAASPRRGQQLV